MNFEPTNVSKLHRGDHAKIKSSGLTGMVEAVTNAYCGSQQVLIQPYVKTGENTQPPAIWVDEQNVTLLVEGDRACYAYAEELLPIKLGDVVKDRVTERVGTVTHITLNLNGCITLDCVPVSQGGENDPKIIYVSQHRVERMPEKNKAPVTTNPKGGAPSRTVQSGQKR